MYFQAPVTYGLSGWAAGSIEFDMRALGNGNSSPGLVANLDWVYPCSSGDSAIGDVVPGEWVGHQVAIRDLLGNSGSKPEPSLLNTPLVFFRTWGNQEGTVIQIDNVRWTR